jgi:REP element-mobilizing transposase RayT
MARPKRINLPHCLYHVISRTNSDDTAFWDPGDYAKFLDYLDKYTHLFDFRIHAFCLMPDHFHLLMESQELVALSEFMRRLLTAYTVYFNRRHKRHGHLFQGRFKSFVVEKSDYLLALSRYIHLNPLKAGMTETPQTYPYSSLQYYINGREPSFLTTKEILGWFQGMRGKYEEFIREGMGKDTKILILKQRYVGGEPFVKRLERRMQQQGLPGGRARKASMRRAERFQEEWKNLAEKMTGRVAQYFGVLPEMVRSGHKLRGAVGKARTVLIAVLREKVPWSHDQISEYLCVKEKSGISYHLRSLMNNQDLIEAFEDLIK